MKLLILDRDGTLNRSRDDYVASADEWEALPGALEAVARLNHGGWRVVLATNQSGIGRGLFEQIGDRFGVPLEAVPVAGNALRHVQAGATAGCPPHLLLTGKSEYLRGLADNDGVLSEPVPGLPEGTRLHEDLSAFADWLLAQPEATT